MNDKDKHFIERYEELLNKGYCDCNEMNCIDNNSPRRILDIAKQLQSNWNSLRECIEENKKVAMEYTKRVESSGLCQGDYPVPYYHAIKRIDLDNLYLDKMNELEEKNEVI